MNKSLSFLTGRETGFFEKTRFLLINEIKVVVQIENLRSSFSDIMPTQIQDSQSRWLKMINFHLHDCVKVKAGTADPDFGNDIGGWQGRIKEIDPESEQEHVVYLVAWDSLTLQAMDLPLIVRSENEGLSWTEMYLFDTDLEAAVSRDTPEDVIKTTKELQQAYRENWQGLKNTAV